jgi:hypothetical protein
MSNPILARGLTVGADERALTQVMLDAKASEIFYNSKENLEAMGIKLVQEKQVNYPTGFPGSFAKPPTEWKG